MNNYSNVYVFIHFQTVQGVFSILTAFALFTFSFLSILFSIFLYMMAQHTHLASSKRNKSTGAHTVKKKNVHSHGELAVVSAAARSLG